MMGFSSLGNAWTAVFPIVLVLYYLFRKRFEPKQVSSVLLWQADRQEEHVSPFIRNLQRNALFYLQLAALLLFVWLLLGPFLVEKKDSGIPLVFIVDSSASMLAAPAGQTLFDSSREAMRKLLAEAGDRPVTIVATGSEPATVLIGQSPAAAADSLDGLEVNYAEPSMQEAIDLVRTLLAEKQGDIHIFTDRLDRSEFKEEAAGMQWHIHANSRPVENRSIVRFGAVRSGDSVTAIVKLTDATEETRPGTVKLEDASSGAVLAEQPAAGTPGEEAYLSFKDVQTDAEALCVQLETDDDYAADNTVCTLLESEPSAVAVDPALHELLGKAVEAVGSEMIMDDGIRTVPDSALRITRSAKQLAEGVRPVLLIGRDDAEPAPAKGDVSATADPLFSISAPEGMYVKSVYPPFDGYEVLASVGGEPLIQRSPRGDIIFLADLEATDWPLQPTFPLFIWSVVHSLSEESETLGVFTPLQRKSVVMASPADIYDMDGAYLSSTGTANTLQAPAKPGIYRAADSAGDKLFAVQLASSQHSAGTGESYSAGQLGGTVGTATSRVPLLWPFIVPLLVLLMIEWEVQRRRGYPY